MIILSRVAVFCLKPKKIRAAFAPILSILLYFPLISQAASPLDVVINEIAWMGTKANSADEWIELYNNTQEPISLEGWALYENGGLTLIEPLSGIINAESYYLIERTDDNTISDIAASQEPSSWGGSGLNNTGEHLVLVDQNSTVIDEVSGWFAGEASPGYKTMERKDSQAPGSIPSNWASNDGIIINGRDFAKNPINGTPKAQNSATINQKASEPAPQPQPEPPSEPAPQQEPEPQEEPGQLPAPGQPVAENASGYSNVITYPSNIAFSEIMPSPNGPDETDEWIELFNNNNFEVALSGWKIRDTAGAITTHTLSKEAKMGPKSFLVLPRPTTKISLNNNSDGLELIQPNGNIADAVNYKSAPKGSSYVFVNGDWSWSAAPTPGSANILPAPKIKQQASEKESVGESVNNDDPLGLASVKEAAAKDKNSFLIMGAALLLAAGSAAAIFFLKKVATK